MNTIAINGKAEADRWMNDAEDLNERTKQAIERMSQLLEDVQRFSKGNIADELVAIGGTVCQKATELFNAMKVIFDVINGLLSTISDVIDKGVEIVKDIATKSFGG